MTTPTAVLSPPGALYEQAAQFGSDLEAMQTAAVDQVLAAHAQVYARIRTEFDAVLDKIAQAQAAGQPHSPAWIYQRTRLKAALASTKVEIAALAEFASETTQQAQWSAIQASVKHAAKMGQTALNQVGVAGSFLDLNPENLKHLVGFLHDGTPLSNLFAVMPLQTAESLRLALVQGVTLGKGVDWMTRRVETALDVPRWRAETIIRTESQRTYRAASRATYEANADVLAGWVWTATLDARVCPACLVMDGTEHPTWAILDGHPRCRCAMVPRTLTYDEILGLPEGTTPDSRPPLRSGKAWLEAQSPATQRALLGPGKWKAWKAGKITLDDVVARHGDDQWGTMRRERSLREIDKGLNPNYPDVPAQPAAPVEYQPQADKAALLHANFSLEALEERIAESPGGQYEANLKAAVAMHLNEQDYGPSLPGPNLHLAEVGTAKMNKAAQTKGYPSKGYSQTVAVYKARANGQVGTKVGIKDPLTWEDKITATKALQDHQEWLDGWLQDQANKALEDAAAKDVAKSLRQQAESNLSNAENHAMVIDAFLGANQASYVIPEGPQRQRYLDWVEQRRSAYFDAKITAGELRSQHGATWSSAAADADLIVDESGWGEFAYGNGGTQTGVNPEQVVKILTTGDYKPVVEADPAKVATLVKGMESKISPGYYDPALVQFLEDGVDSGTLSGASKAEAVEALNQVKATLLPPAQASVIDANVDVAIGGGPDLTKILVDAFQKSVDDDDWKATPNGLSAQQNKSNALATLKALKELQVAENAASSHGPNGEPDLAEPPLAMGIPKDPSWPDPTPSSVATKLQQMLDDPDIVPYFQEDAKADVDTGLTPKGKASAWQALYEYGLLQGDPNTTGAVDASLAPAGPPPGPFGAPPSASSLRWTGQTFGTHGAKVYEGTDGTRYLVKPPKSAADQFLVEVDVAASVLQARAGLAAPDTWVMEVDGKRASVQRMFDASPAFPGGFSPANLSPADLLAVQQQHVLDWLLGNHDGHLEQFLRLPSGELVGIDKGQAFRWIGQDRLDWNFHPNSHYGAPPPVYNALWSQFAGGGSVELLDPRSGPLAEFIQGLQDLPDDEIRALFRPYAEGAAARGLLASPQPTFPGVKVPPQGLPTNDVEGFLDLLVARKAALDADFTALYLRAAKDRKANKPGWKPTKAAPTAASKAKAKAKALKGAPEPVKPDAPKTPDEQGTDLFQSWIDAAEARYQANPNKAKANLQATANWMRFQTVMGDDPALARKAVQELVDRKYLDDALRDQALFLIDQRAALQKSAKADYDLAYAGYERALAKWAKDIEAWRKANGIVIRYAGMDQAVVRHDDNAAGKRWATARWQESGWTQQERTALRSYTGSSYSTWNDYLRRNDGDPGPYKATLDKIDKAMPKQPVPEDVIVHRGTGVDSFTVGGVRLRLSDTHRLQELVGTVQRDEAYLSTSVGNTAAFQHYTAQIKFRVPKGTPAAYVDTFSSHSGERELLLGRGTSYYVHAVYQAGGKWIVEAEIVDRNWTPPLDANGKPITSPSTRPWTG